MGYTLTAEELAAFTDDGLVIPQYRLSDRLYEQAKAAVDQMIDELDAVGSEFALVAHLPRRPGVAGGSPGGEKVFRVAIEPEILDLVEAVLGPDLILWGSSLFAKPAGVGKRVQWHQDSNWWPMKPMVTATVWIAIDEASTDNGCLRFIPGTHLWPVLPHVDQTEDGLLGDCIQRSVLDGALPRDIVLEPGHFSIHQANLVHGSEPNVSTRRLAGLVLRYMPATALFDRSDAEEIEQGSLMKTGDTAKYGVRPIWLVRGENRHPGNDFVVGHEPLADLDDLVAAAREASHVL
jgi:hypothetical protein